MKERIKLGLILIVSISIFSCNNSNDHDKDMTDSTMYDTDNMNGQNTDPSLTPTRDDTSMNKDTTGMQK
jgi:hypothetical protein